MKYGVDVKFEGGRYFAGAIDIDWYLCDLDNARNVSEAYMFHGKQYHSVNNVSQSGGYKVTDSITMTEILLENLCKQNNRLILSIAGYGAGKTHLAVALSMLFSGIGGNQQEILNKIKNIDSNAGIRIGNEIFRDERPYLVIPINGMRNSGLADLFFDSAEKVLELHQVSKIALTRFRPQFNALKQQVMYYNGPEVDKALRIAGISSRNDFAKEMDVYNYDVYDRIVAALEIVGVQYYVPAVTGQLKDLIIALAEELCGKGKPFRGLLIVFDELGKYMSFSAANEGIAGSGIMQQLYEGVQGVRKDVPVLFWGISQLDLKEYQQGLANNVAANNNMNRYVTRFSNAKKYYLGTCFESLIANLIVKNSEPEGLEDPKEVGKAIKMLSKVFSAAKNYPVWTDEDKFAKIVRKGCWPLSSAAVWTLTYITSVNNILQQRSGFNIISTLFDSLNGIDIGNNKFPIKAVDLYDCGLGEEFLIAEQSSRSSSSIANECNAVINKYGQKLSANDIKVLHAIVLAEKLKAECNSEQESKQLLAFLSGLSNAIIEKSLNELFNIYNCISFNTASFLYEIHSNAATLMQFAQFIKEEINAFQQKINNKIRYATLEKQIRDSNDFGSWRERFFEDIECRFSFDHNILSWEWGYEHRIIINSYISSIRYVLNELKEEPPIHFAEQKGRMIYLVLPSFEDLGRAKTEIKALFDDYEKSVGNIVPAMVLILYDKDDKLLNVAIELDILDSLNASETKKYGNLINNRYDELYNAAFDILNELKAQRNLVYPIGSSKARFITGSQIFSKIYTSAISFYIDGFKQVNANGPNTVNEFVNILSRSGVTHNDFITLTSSEKNRAQTLLTDGWKIFDNNGNVQKYPGDKIIAELFKSFDEVLRERKIINVYADLYAPLLAPPYGCNSTQATALVFVYYAGRQSTLEFSQNNTQVPISNLLQQKGCFSTKEKAMKKAFWHNVFVKESTRDDAKWFKLKEDWTNAQLLPDYIVCLNTYNQLIESSISIPNIILDDIILLRTKTGSLCSLNKKWKAEGSIIHANINQLCNQRKPIDEVINVFFTYIKLYNQTIGQSKAARYENDIDDYKDVIDNTKIYIKNNIDGWINSNDPVVNFSEYRQKFSAYASLIKQLESLSLKDEADKVRKAYDGASITVKAINEFNKNKQLYENQYSSIEKNVKYGLVAYNLAVGCKQDIDILMGRLESFSDSYVGLPQYLNFNGIKARLIGLKNITETKLQEMKEKADSIPSLKCDRICEIQDSESVVNSVLQFYQNEEGKPEYQEYTLAKHAKAEIELLKRAFLVLSQKVSSVAMIESTINAYNDKFEELDFIPIPYKSVLNSFKGMAYYDLQQKSTEWKDEQIRRYNCANTMDDLITFQAMLNNQPDYLSESDKREIEELRMVVSSKISKRKVEFLVSQYRQLNEDEQKDFLSRI